MSSSDDKKASFGNPIVNLVLTGIVFLFFTWILKPFVPPTNAEWLAWLFSAFAATALTLTFYFSINMFRVTLNDHKNREG